MARIRIQLVQPSAIIWASTRALLGLALSVTLGCQGDTTGPTPLASSQLYWRLALDHHAITMALVDPYDTLQLRATPYAVSGTALADSSATQYRSTDSLVVNVSPTGLLTARQSGSNIAIIAQHRYRGLTLTDTAYVNVNDVTTIPVFTTMTLTPQPGDSNVFGFSEPVMNNYNSVKDLVSQTLDQHGNAIPNVLVYYSSADTTIVRFVDPAYPEITPVRLGATMVYSEATIYGVRKVDSLRFADGYPVQGSVEVLPEVTHDGAVLGYFSPGTLTVNVGAVVAWYSAVPNGHPIDVVFDDPAAAQPVDSTWFVENFFPYAWYNGAAESGVIPNDHGGNFSGLAYDSTCVGGLTGNTCSSYYVIQARARTFTTVGTYPYHSTLYGTSGVIKVMNNP